MRGRVIRNGRQWGEEVTALRISSAVDAVAAKPAAVRYRACHNIDVSILSYIFALAAGSANPIQAGASSQLNKGLASPIWSAAFVYASGLTAILLIQVIVRQAWPGHRLATVDVPWWAWMGGVLSIASTLSGLTLAQKMGSGLFTGLSLTASLSASVLLDHFGLMGFTSHPLSPFRLIGAGLMIAGIWLIAKF
jgi:transporter family-2 protein